MEQAQNFSGEDFRILFCSENCFQQSSYYQDKTNQNNNKQRKNINNNSRSKPNENTQQSTQPEPDLCSGHGCLKEILPNQTYYYHPNHPNIKLCSQSCYLNYYGEFCHKCKNTFLKENLHAPFKENSHYLLCLNCYEKHQQEQIERNRKFCFQCSTELNEFNNKKPPFRICDFCFERDLERAEKEAELERSRFRENNHAYDNLKSQISQLESAPNSDKNLLQEKREELRRLEKELKENNQQEQKDKNIKLWLGIGSGVVGLGLLGILVWLVFRKEKNNV